MEVSARQAISAASQLPALTARDTATVSRESGLAAFLQFALAFTS